MDREHGKIIPFRAPGRERRRMTVFLGVLAVLVLIVAFFAVDGGRNWDSIRRFFAYGSEQVHIDRDTAPAAMTELDGNLVTAGADGITAYSRTGTVRFMVTTPMHSPVLQTGGRKILAYDAGGTDLLLLDEDGTELLRHSTSGLIFDADAAPDGSVCYVTEGDRTRSVLQVYDREQLPCYTVNSATRYLTACTVADGADFVCAVALGQEDGLFASRAVIYRTDREEPVAEVGLGSQLIYDVEFWGKDTICALGEDSLIVFTTKGEVLGTCAAEGAVDFDLNGDDFAALVVPGDTGYDLITVSRNARVIGRRNLGPGGASVDVNGKYVACLTDAGFTVSGRKLETWYETDRIGTADQVCMCAVGTAYLVDTRGAELFLP